MTLRLRLRILVRRLRRPACETVPCPPCRAAGQGLTERTAWHRSRRWWRRWGR